MIKMIDKNVFAVEKMRSGRLSVSLTSDVGWEGFPGYVLKFLEIFPGRVMMKNDSVDTRVWKVIISEQEYDMVYEDFPVLISIESKSERGDLFLLSIGSALNGV